MTIVKIHNKCSNVQLSSDFRQKVYNSIIAKVADQPGRRALKVRLEAESFRDCGHKKAVYQCPVDGHNYGIKTSCKSRLCPVCGQKMSRRYFSQIREVLESYLNDRRPGWTTAFLTLTLKKRQGMAAGDFQNAWRKVSEFLRYHYGAKKARIGRNGRVVMSSKWKGAGAIAVPEVGPSGNLHFHVIIHGPVYRKEILSANWRAFTGDSFIVDIQKIRGRPKSVAGYITKYISKPVPVEDPDLWADMFFLLKGIRRIKYIGIFYGLRLKSLYKPEKKRCLYCGSLLQFKGVWEDPRKKLIDWLSYKKYVDFNENNPKYIRLPYSRQPDLTFFEDQADG